MSFDRETALKTAEKALRLGRIDAAITEYVRIIDAHPRDWNSANALGDLYVRANQVDRGVEQFTRIAEHLAKEGFYPKAAALFKKILKIRPGDEHALLMSGDIAAVQGLLADAKNAYKAVAERRRSRGDKPGAAEVEIRLGRLDPEDLEARLGAARAACEIGDATTALQEFRDVAREFEKRGNNEARLDVLAEVARLDPNDLPVRVSLAQGYAAVGNLDRARQYLDAQTAGQNATLWLTLAEIELTAGRLEEGRAAVATCLSLDAAMREAVVALGCRLTESSTDASYQCIESAAESAVATQDFAAAAGALQEFVARVPAHLIALMRLVEICVDGGLETTMYEAQSQLADAYLEVGRGLEARIISEDLVARDPSNRANVDRLRRALVMLGEADPEAIISERLSGDSPFLPSDDLDLNDGSFFDDGDAVSSTAPGTPVVAAGRVKATAPPVASELEDDGHAEDPADSEDVPPRSLEQVFEEIRYEVTEAPDEEAAAEQYALGLTYQELGMVDDAIEALKEAARSPRQRFEAASLLGRLFRERGEAASAIDWFERAAAAPPTSAAAGHGLLYDLADTLEGAGEKSRALAVFVELEAESGGFRDVADRVNRLSKVQAKQGSRR